jgi:RHS repeat-associated protein
VRRVFASTANAPAYGYDPYGRALQSTAPLTDFNYAGTFYSSDSGLYLTQYRAYDPVAARWLSRDPLYSQPLRLDANSSDNSVAQPITNIDQTPFKSNPSSTEADPRQPLGAANLYQYVVGNPAASTDPTGLGGLSCQGFPAGCQSGGSYGTSAMYCVGGKNLCRNCAVKILGIGGESQKEVLQILNNFRIGGK